MGDSIQQLCSVTRGQEGCPDSTVRTLDGVSSLCTGRREWGPRSTYKPVGRGSMSSNSTDARTGRA